MAELFLGEWAQFDCCGRTWYTLFWLLINGRVACPTCGKLYGKRQVLREYQEVTVDHVSE